MICRRRQLAVLRAGTARAVPCLWVDVARADPEDLRALLERLGVPDAAAGEACAALTHPAAAMAAARRVGDVLHLSLRSLAGPPDYAPRGELQVLWGPRLLITARTRPYPAMARIWHRGAAAEGGPAAVIADLLTPAVGGAKRHVRRLVDRGEAVTGQVVRRRGGPGTWSRILSLRRDALHLNRRLSSLGATLTRLGRDPGFDEGDDAAGHLSALGDRLSDISDALDALREAMSSTMEAYASIQSNRINRTMQVLTVLSVVFLPATLIASIYGMNFAIPELHWRYGYAYALLLMAGITCGLLLMARQRGWMR